MFVIVSRVLIIHSKKKLESIHSEKSRKQKKLSKGIFKAMISIVSVMMMFGLSWIFGAFSVSEGAIVFQWLFVIFNTTQGFMLFVFFCVIGGDARDEWKNLLTCNKYRNKVSLNASTTNSHSKSGFNHRRRQGKSLRSGAETLLTSDGRTSNTIRRSAGLPPVEDDSIEKIELPSRYSIVSTEAMRSQLTSINEDNTFEEHVDTSLIISNGQHKLKKSKQLPPHVYIKLKRPIYSVETITYDDDEKLDLSLSDYDVVNRNGVQNDDDHDLMISNSFQHSEDLLSQQEKVDLSFDNKNTTEMLNDGTSQNEDDHDAVFGKNLNEESLMESLGLDITEPATQISMLSNGSEGTLPLDCQTEEENVLKTDTLTNLDDLTPDNIDSSQTAVLLNNDMEEEITSL